MNYGEQKNDVLITGSSGFIGGQLAAKLLNDDSVNSLTLLNYTTANKLHAPHGKLIYQYTGSINNYNLLSSIISEREINIVYHLAANAIVRQCANDPMNAYYTNVMGTVTLLEACRNVGAHTVKSIVISTSDKAYGHSIAPYDEETPFLPRFTYDATKSCQDIVAQNYFHNYGLPIRIIRSSNVYGPNDPNNSRLIPKNIMNLHNDRPATIYKGVDKYVREFIFVNDVVDAFIKVGQSGNSGEAYCVGNNAPISIYDLIETMCKLMDKNPKNFIQIVDVPQQFKEIECQYMTGEKLKSLGWNPRWPLIEGLKETIKFYTQ